MIVTLKKILKMASIILPDKTYIQLAYFRRFGRSVMASVVLIPNYKISGLVAAALVASTFDFVQYVLVYRKYRR